MKHNIPEIDILVRTLAAYGGSVWWLDFKHMPNPYAQFRKDFIPDCMTSMLYDKVHLN